MSKMLNYIYKKYYSQYRERKAKKYIAWKSKLFTPLFQPNGIIPFDEFVSKIQKMGVTNSDNILLRLSSQTVPYLENGLIGFYKNIFDYVDKGSGNVMSLSYTFDRSPLMYLSKNPVFTPEESPTTIGLCNEIFRRMDGVSRSIHPTHSVSVYGNNSEKITGSHHLDKRTYSELSPFAYLYKYGSGKEIIIGLNHSTVGQHFIEEKAFITGHIKEPILCNIKLDGKINKIPFFADNPFVKNISKFHTESFISLLKKEEILKQTFINGISIYVYDSNKFFDRMSTIYNSDLKPYINLQARTFILNRAVRPLILKSFFKQKNGLLIPKERS